MTLHPDVARTASLLARIRLEMAEQPTTRPSEKQRAAGDCAALERIATVISATGNGERRVEARRSAIEKEATRVDSTASSRI